MPPSTGTRYPETRAGRHQREIHVPGVARMLHDDGPAGFRLCWFLRRRGRRIGPREHAPDRRSRDMQCSATQHVGNPDFAHRRAEGFELLYGVKDEVGEAVDGYGQLDESVFALLVEASRPRGARAMLLFTHQLRTCTSAKCASAMTRTIADLACLGQAGGSGTLGDAGEGIRARLLARLVPGVNGNRRLNRCPRRATAKPWPPVEPRRWEPHERNSRPDPCLFVPTTLRPSRNS